MRRPRPDPAGPGQESVCAYPRPPRLETSSEPIRVTFAGAVVAETATSYRVLETSHPPTYYLPMPAFAPGVLRAAPGSSFCEWKGRAAYFDVVTDDRIAEHAAWTYPNPSPGFEMLIDHVALMPAAMDVITVDGEQVRPQDGGFYGGWITSRVVGPFKGGPGSMGW